jgi:hypothetical protein
MEGQTENFTPREQSSPLGSKFAPRGEVKNGPLVTLAPGHLAVEVVAVVLQVDAAEGRVAVAAGGRRRGHLGPM